MREEAGIIDRDAGNKVFTHMFSFFLVQVKALGDFYSPG